MGGTLSGSSVRQRIEGPPLAGALRVRRSTDGEAVPRERVISARRGPLAAESQRIGDSL